MARPTHFATEAAMAKDRQATDQKQGRSNQERLRSIIDQLPDGITIVDRDGVIRFANGAAEELFGRNANELIGRDLGFPVVAGESIEVDVVRPSGQPVTAELRVVDTEWDGESALLVSPARRLRPQSATKNASRNSITSARRDRKPKRRTTRNRNSSR